jgi:hypothetical protein
MLFKLLKIYYVTSDLNTIHLLLRRTLVLSVRYSTGPFLLLLPQRERSGSSALKQTSSLPLQL